MTTFHTPERQERHARLIAEWKHSRNPQALQAIMHDYQPLFHAQIGQVMRGRTLSTDHQADLLQECAYALVRALDGFDASKGVSIAPYLMRHVKGAMRRYVLDFRAACRLGTNSDDRKAYYAAQRLRVRRLTEGQETLAESDVAAVAHDSATSLTVARRAVLAMNAGTVGIEALPEEDQATVETTSPLDRRALDTAMAAFERHALALPERTRTIVCETLLGHRVEGAVERMAQRYDLTPRRVRQIQAEGLGMLRTLLAGENITAESVF